jgi:hypothetical protein
MMVGGIGAHTLELKEVERTCHFNVPITSSWSSSHLPVGQEA